MITLANKVSHIVVVGKEATSVYHAGLARVPASRGRRFGATTKLTDEAVLPPPSQIRIAPNYIVVGFNVYVLQDKACLGQNRRTINCVYKRLRKKKVKVPFISFL